MTNRIVELHVDHFSTTGIVGWAISIVDKAIETCPLFFGGVERTHLGFEDPARATGTEEEVLTAFRRVRNQIRETVEIYLRSAEGAFAPDLKDEGKIK